MARFKSASRYLLAALVMLALLLGAEASIYSKKRGLKTAGLSNEQIAEYMKDHDSRHILHKHKHKDGLKAHPEVKRYLEWREKMQEGHPDTGVAFAGKIPHDYIPYLLEKPEAHKDL